ncbi:MAG: 30S ribosomal protein S6 [Gammaproteobacteria bacterium]|nr:30S ribosomal protein S6 [Gammaproteobacteria bacterium]
MPLYESTFVARPDVSTQQVETLGEELTEIIRTAGGEVASSENWGLRNLTYKIKKNRKGHYIHFRINAPAEAIAEMERNMRLNEDIIRFLTIKVETLDEGPSAMMQSRPREIKNDRRTPSDDRDANEDSSQSAVEES